MKKLIKSFRYKNFVILVIKENASYRSVIKHEEYDTQLTLHSALIKDVRLWDNIVDLIATTKQHIDDNGMEMLNQIIEHEKSKSHNN